MVKATKNYVPTPARYNLAGSREPKVLTTPEQYAEEGKKAVVESYDCVKIDPIMFDSKGQRWSNLHTILIPEILR